MKVILTILACIISMGGIVSGDQDPGLKIVQKLDSANYRERIGATLELTEYVQAKYTEVAREIALEKSQPESWQELVKMITGRVEHRYLSKLRDAANNLGPEPKHRFSELEGTWEEYARNAAITAGLEAPGDYEAEILKKLGGQSSARVLNGVIAIQEGGRISSLNLSGSHLDAETLRRLAAFSELNTLAISRVGLSPDVIIDALESCQAPVLCFGQGMGSFSEQVLKDLASIPNLKQVTLVSTQPNWVTEIIHSSNPEIAVKVEHPSFSNPFGTIRIDGRARPKHPIEPGWKSGWGGGGPGAVLPGFGH